MLSQSQAANNAQRLLFDFMIENPTDISIENLAFELRILVFEDDLKGVAARIVFDNETGIIKVDRKIKSEGRKRFAIAHEIGHFRLHRNIKPLFVCTEAEFFDWYKTSGIESQANAFAAELLMPTHLFKECVKKMIPSKTNLINCADQFKVSLTASCIKYAECGSVPCILFMAGKDGIKWFKKNEDFTKSYIKQPGERISENSCAGAYHYESFLESEPSEVAWSSWFNNPVLMFRNEKIDLREGVKVFESVIDFPQIQQTLSLVWID